MSDQLFVASANGLVIGERDEGGWKQGPLMLAGHCMTSLVESDGALIAGTRDGIYRSSDRGQSWVEAGDGLTTRYVRALAAHPTLPGIVFAGTEPAAIFGSRDGGKTWREAPEVAQLRDMHGWFLPYSPGAGCIRAFTMEGRRIYAAAEVGGVLRSDDTGQTWRLACGSTGNPDFRAPVPRTFLHPDVHEVAVIPGMADHIYAPTMRGLYRSPDGGCSWLHLYADCYTRAIWIDPADPAHLILGPADDVEINGQIEESSDGGFSWKLASDGLKVPWRRAIVEHFTQLGDDLLAILSNGELYGTRLPAFVWRRLLPGISNIAAVVALPRDSAAD